MLEKDIQALYLNGKPFWNIVESNGAIQMDGKRYVELPVKVQVKENYAFEPGVDPSYYNKVKWSYPDVKSLQGDYFFNKGDQAECIGIDGDYYVVQNLYNHENSGPTKGNLIAAVKKDIFLPIWG